MTEPKINELTLRAVKAGHAYGRWPGEVGTHAVHPGQMLMVVNVGFMDNNSAEYVVLEGHAKGQTFVTTAEHFNPAYRDDLLASVREDIGNCYENGYELFDEFPAHRDTDVAADMKEQTTGYEDIPEDHLARAVAIVRAEREQEKKQ